MNLNKQKTMILAIMILMILLHGCTTASITYQIKEDHTVKLEYKADVDISHASSDLKKGLSALCENTIQHYQTLGFETDYRITDDQILISMILKQDNPDYKSAYENLKTIMDDPKLTFLIASDLSYLITENQHAITADMVLDLDKMLDAFGLYQLPSMIKDDLLSSLKQSELTINLILPATTIVDKNENITVSTNNNGTMMSQRIKLDEPTEFFIKGYILYDNDKAIQLDYDDMIQKTKSSITILKFSQYGLVLITISTLILVIHKHNKEVKSNKKDPNR
ncbi:MAG: hypothetical protein PHP11_02855 [Erysipelotrichaceae bacterium]|nr:hypothetical protein [Erysipelotrichaceae bacterium]